MTIDEKALRNDFESFLRGEEPPATALATAPRLDGWNVAVTRAHVGGYRMTLVGRITGHPLLQSGRQIETSELVWLDRNGGWARTMSRVYVLVTPAGSESRN